MVNLEMVYHWAMKVINPVPLGSAFRSRPIGGPAGVSCNEGTRERENEGVAIGEFIKANPTQSVDYVRLCTVIQTHLRKSWSVKDHISRMGVKYVWNQPDLNVKSQAHTPDISLGSNGFFVEDCRVEQSEVCQEITTLHQPEIKQFWYIYIY